MSIETKFVNTYWADGCCVPAHRVTAYSLSAGGPIVYPGSDVVVVTPVATQLERQAPRRALDSEIVLVAGGRDALFLLSMDSRSFLGTRSRSAHQPSGFRKIGQSGAPGLFSVRKKCIGDLTRRTLKSGQSLVFSCVEHHDEPSQHATRHNPNLVFPGLVAFCHGPLALAKRPGAGKEMGLQRMMCCKGDLNPHNMFRSMGLPAYGMYFRQNIDARLSLRAQIMQGRFEVWDGPSRSVAAESEPQCAERDSRILALCRLNFRKHVVMTDPSMVPFLYAGAAIYNHDPEGYHVDGDREYGWLALQPMGTEGQGSVKGLSYPLFGRFAIPYGLGWKAIWVPGCRFQFGGLADDFYGLPHDVSGAYAEISSESPVAILMSILPGGSTDLELETERRRQAP